MKATEKELNNFIHWINDNTVGFEINTGMSRNRKIEDAARRYKNDKIISNELKELMPDWLKIIANKVITEAS